MLPMSCWDLFPDYMIESKNLTDKKINTSILKRDIIPTEWKNDIDKRLIDDLLYANRYFASSNPKMKDQITKEIKTVPTLFYKHLVDRWDWHNNFYEGLLEPALPLILESNHFSLSPYRIKALTNSYSACSAVDMATLPMTGAIKSYLNVWTVKLSIYMSDEEKRVLLTPPTESFYAKYAQDHLTYIYYSKINPKKSEIFKAELLKKYHADDNKVFAGRITKFEKYVHQMPKKLKQEINKYDIKDEYKIDHFYSTIEKPQLKAIRDIITYDNYDEYLILYSLIGISGYILRKRVLEYLNDTKILPNSGKIYEFSDNKVVNSLKKLEKYRKEVLHKNVKAYVQTDLTCASVCLMMILNYYDILDANIKNETLIHSKAKSTFIDGDHFSGLAFQAASLGLETLLIHSSPKMFRNNGTMSKELFENLMKEYKDFLYKSIVLGTKVKNGQEISTESIKKLLEQDYLVVIAGKMGSMLHAVLAIGYNQDGVIVIDPIDGRTHTKDKSDLKRFMGTGIGNWLLAIKQDQKPLDKLHKEIPNFLKHAKNYLGKGGD